MKKNKALTEEPNLTGFTIINPKPSNKEFLSYISFLMKEFKAGRLTKLYPEQILILLVLLSPKIKGNYIELLHKYCSIQNLFNRNQALLKKEGFSLSAIFLINFLRMFVITYTEPETIYDTPTELSSPESVATYLKVSMSSLEKEHFLILCLNTRNELLHKEVIGIGSLTECAISTGEIFKLALIHNASALIIVHNHPSNDATPSHYDLDLTQKLLKTAQVFSIRLHDHFIVSRRGIFSTQKEAYISPEECS